MFVNELSPIIFSIGPFALRWYSLVYLIAFVTAYILLKKKGKELIPGWKEEYTDKIITYLFLGMLIGARFFHVFIFEPTYYFQNPQYILAIWRGGLAFHGALIGMTIATIIFTKKYKIKFYDIADFMVIPTAFFLIFGRIANFINSEMPGIISNISWCVEFVNAPDPAHRIGCRHPTQIYEAIKNVFIFSGLLVLWKYKRKLVPGTIFWSFIASYGLIRFLLMYLRDETTVFLGLTGSQIFSGLMFITAMYFLFKNKK